MLRCGRVLGASANGTAGDAILGPGWHWSWPYPIERWETVSRNEREIPVPFMFELSDEERAGGITGYKYNLLSPLRDDYLITGNVNILHASLTVKYRISDAVAYLTNVAPMPDAYASARSKDYLLYPEYTMLTNLVRNAVIETAAQRTDLDIRGAKQNEFLQAVASCATAKLKALEQAGAPLGISIDPANGILAPKTGGVEGIMPPRQTQQAFEEVDKALSGKVIAITKATSAAQGLLVKTAGMDYEALAGAIDKEFDLMHWLSAASPQGPQAATLRDELSKQRAKSEKLLLDAAGDVRGTIKRAEIKRGQIIQEASGDYQQFIAVLPEYNRNPEVFVSQLLIDTFATALDSDQIGKIFVPESSKAFWLQIPRTSVPITDPNKPQETKPGVIEPDSPRTMRQPL